MWRYESLDTDNSNEAIVARERLLNDGWEPFAVSTRHIIFPGANTPKEVDRIHFRKKVD